LDPPLPFCDASAGAAIINSPITTANMRFMDVLLAARGRSMFPQDTFQ